MTIERPADATKTEEAWWKQTVIYQVYPRSFQDSNGDGVGDLAGVIARLDYLVALGVDAVWLSPFFCSPMEDFGYDVSDHIAVDPLFGDMGDFRRLVADAHSRGLRVRLETHGWVVRRSRFPPMATRIMACETSIRAS